MHSFIHDVSGLEQVVLVLRTAKGEKTVAMTDQGPYPSQTGPCVTARFFTSKLPIGIGEVSYYIEAEDKKETAPAARWSGSIWRERRVR